MINPATGELITEFGPLAEAEIILLDEINRIPLKSQSAFLEGLQDRTVTVGKTTYELPAFSFAIATMNPVELGQGTFPLSEAATDRFAIMVNIGYLPPEEERKLVNFDFKRIRLNPLMAKERIIELRAAINQHVFLHEALGDYIQRAGGGDAALQPRNRLATHSPSELVERGVDLGASPRAIICWGRLAKVWALLVRAPRRGLSGRHSGPGAVRARPSHLARAARGQPRPHDRSGDRRRRPAGADSVRTRGSWTPATSATRAAHQPVGHHRDRAAHPEADARVHDRRARQPLSRVGLRLRRPARMAGRRSLRVDRLAAVVADQLQPAHRPRVRAAEHVERGHGGRSIALDALRHRRRADRRDHRAHAGDDRHVGGVLPGLDRPGHVRSRVHAAAGPAAAHRQGPGHPLSRRLSVRRTACRICARPAISAASLAGFMRKTSMVPVISDFLFDDVDGLFSELAHLNSLHDVFLAHRRRVVRLRAARRLGRLDRSVRRRERPLARDVAARAERRWRRACATGRTTWRRRRRTRASTCCASAHDQTKFDIALLEWVAERRLAALGETCDRCTRCDRCDGASATAARVDCWSLAARRARRRSRSRRRSRRTSRSSRSPAGGGRARASVRVGEPFSIDADLLGARDRRGAGR